MSVTWERIRDGAGYDVDIAVIGAISWRVAPWGRRFVIQNRPRHNGVPWREVKKSAARASHGNAGPRLWATREAAQRAAEAMAAQVSSQAPEKKT